jgi:hypothetical protein
MRRSWCTKKSHFVMSVPGTETLRVHATSSMLVVDLFFLRVDGCFAMCASHSDSQSWVSRWLSVWLLTCFS